MGDFEYFIRESNMSRDAKYHGFADSLNDCIDLFRSKDDCKEMSVFNEKIKEMYFYGK